MPHGQLKMAIKLQGKQGCCSFVDLVKCRIRKLLKTKFSTEKGTFPEGRGMSLSRENWFCRLAKYCACSSQRNVYPIALLLTCVTD